MARIVGPGGAATLCLLLGPLPETPGAKLINAASVLAMQICAEQAKEIVFSNAASPSVAAAATPNTGRSTPLVSTTYPSWGRAICAPAGNAVNRNAAKNNIAQDIDVDLMFS